MIQKTERRLDVSDMDFDKKLFDKIFWDMSGAEVESESFRRIEENADRGRFFEDEWKVVRRLIHTTADFAIGELVRFGGDPIEVGRARLKEKAAIYTDSNMIRSGVSEFKLKKFNAAYSKENDVVCHIADQDVAMAARERGVTRALAAVEKFGERFEGSIVLVGNAPLALAGVIRLAVETGIRPSLIVGMPVGFVNVVESKELLAATDIPHVLIEGNRGGSPLAVATLHAIMEE